MKQILTALAGITILMFACKKKDSGPPPAAPLVKTAALTNVVASSGTATAGGSIVSDNGAAITKSGIAWSQGHSTPSITDSVIEATATSGAFTVNINGIDFGKTYYFRAFATNSVGTGYGDVVTLTTSNDSVRFTYNGQSVTYGIIVSPTSGKKWLDRNIGATRAATSYGDYQAYGDMFQWGRPADGHQLMNWTSSTTGTPVNGAITVLATTGIPGHSSFINSSSAGHYDWTSDYNINRWMTAPQGPCPTGWHVPTKDEWAAEVPTSSNGTATTGGITDNNTAYSLLKLTGASLRRGYGSTGEQIIGPGGNGMGGYYWSSTSYVGLLFDESQAYYFAVYSGGVNTGSALARKCAGYLIRCIKD